MKDDTIYFSRFDTETRNWSVFQRDRRGDEYWECDARDQETARFIAEAMNAYDGEREDE